MPEHFSIPKGQQLCLLCLWHGRLAPWCLIRVQEGTHRDPHDTKMAKAGQTPWVMPNLQLVGQPWGLPQQATHKERS